MIVGWDKDYHSMSLGGPVEAVNPEEAVRDQGMVDHMEIRVYPVEVDEQGNAVEYKETDLDL